MLFVNFSATIVEKVKIDCNKINEFYQKCLNLVGFEDIKLIHSIYDNCVLDYIKVNSQNPNIDKIQTSGYFFADYISRIMLEGLLDLYFSDEYDIWGFRVRPNAVSYLQHKWVVGSIQFL